MEGDTTHVSLACCDLARIVIGAAVIERAFAEAIAAQGIVTGTQSYARAMVRFDRGRGRPPAEILHDLFDGDATRAGIASMAFDQSFRDAAERFGVAAPDGLVTSLRQLAEAGLRVCLMTVLSRAATAHLVARLRRQGIADLVLCGDDAPRGFPWPDLVLTAMLKLGVGDVREVAVIGATESCVESGRRAGAGLIVGVAEGSRRAAALREAGATHVQAGPGGLRELLAPAS